MLVCLAASHTLAQTPAPTPDPFFMQITASNANAFVGGISGNGRFVVFESTGDLATLHPGESTRAVNNADANREIFLYDYAQRRIFQITNTTVARVNAANPAFTVNATTGVPDFSNTDVEVSNNRPVISRDGRWIVFSSNANTPFSFDGDANKAALKTDGNQEIFLYRIPDAPAANLRSGADVAFFDLRRDSFTRVTNTPASSLPQAGTATRSPQVADDNRSAQLNDRASRIVFVSTRDFAAKNGDANPEIFVWNRTSNADVLAATGTFTQVTNTSGLFTFNDNPNISGDTSSDDGAEDPRSVIAFISNATVMRDINDATVATNNADGNAEVFVTNFNGAAATGLLQATRTRRTTSNDLVNLLNPGPRLSRDGRLVAFETVATDPKADTTTNQAVRGMYVYVIATDTFIQIGPRGSATDNEEDILRFPVFTGDSSRLVFSSILNFTASGTRVAPADATGLNPGGFKQIYSVPVPASASAAQTFTRLSNLANSGSPLLQPFVSNTTERLAFSFNGELGGGNADSSNEAFYLIVPPAAGATNTPAASSALSFFTGATLREVVTPPATPTPTPSPVPAATPITGLAPGMIGVVRAPSSEGGVRFAAANTRVCEPQATCGDAASESHRRPSLPVELSGVSLSINNFAAGLYFVSPTEIQFVVPPALPLLTGANTYPVVINVNEGGTVRTIRSVLQIVGAQPDIFTRADAPTRASVFNVTTGTLMGEPANGFPVTTDVMGTAKPTVLAIFVTGIRGVPPASITVMIGDRNLTGTAEIQSNTATDMPGVNQLNIQLRPDLAGLGDQPLVITATVNNVAYTSRPAASAPRIRIR